MCILTIKKSYFSIDELVILCYISTIKNGKTSRQRKGKKP
uniref:Uncharacterized protein n=1 Tax=Siphoviridae sp. ct2vX3 TaxID=2825318 RepID=A0A8S5PYZ4_9CAUD|nr:MAG TPA: hypothetical protein [Siphoviridae sp. ct2vX3]